MPEWALRCYQRMLPRLQGEETNLASKVALATNQREMTDRDRREFYESLQPDRDGAAPRPKRAPKVTAGFLGGIGSVKVNVTSTPVGNGGERQ